MDERLASVEANVEAMGDLRSLIAEVRAEMNAWFTGVNGQFTELRGDMNSRFEDVNRRIGSLDTKVDRQFVWLMGVMVTGFITIIGALVGVVYR